MVGKDVNDGTECELISRGDDLSPTELTLSMVKLIMEDKIGGSWKKNKETGENLATSSINVSSMVRADQPGRMSNTSKLPSHYLGICT